MKLLVTGGAGFIGSAVVRLAVGRGYEVVNVDALTYAGCLENVAVVSDSPLYAFEHVDIRDRTALDAVFGKHEPDAVMHLAAESHVDLAKPLTPEADSEVLAMGLPHGIVAEPWLDVPPARHAATQFSLPRPSKRERRRLPRNRPTLAPQVSV